MSVLEEFNSDEWLSWREVRFVDKQGHETEEADDNWGNDRGVLPRIYSAAP